MHIPPGLPEATQTQRHCAGGKRFRERKGLTFSSHQSCSSEASPWKRMRRNVTGGRQLMWPFVGQMGRGKRLLIQYFFLSSIVSHCTCNLQLKAVHFFTVFVSFGTLESFTHDIKETTTTVTYNVIICAEEFASIIKHLPCF